MNILSIDELIFINQWSQGVKENAEIKDFIEKKSLEDLHSLLVWSGELARQASANDQDAAEAIEQVPFKRTRSACVILVKGVSMATYRKMETLKGSDGKDAVWLFLYLFQIADKRRRSLGNQCSHWWHKDLSQESVVEQIKRDYEAVVL